MAVLYQVSPLLLCTTGGSRTVGEGHAWLVGGRIHREIACHVYRQRSALSHTEGMQKRLMR